MDSAAAPAARDQELEFVQSRKVVLHKAPWIVPSGLYIVVRKRHWLSRRLSYHIWVFIVSGVYTWSPRAGSWPFSIMSSCDLFGVWGSFSSWGLTYWTWTKGFMKMTGSNEPRVLTTIIFWNTGKLLLGWAWFRSERAWVCSDSSEAPSTEVTTTRYDRGDDIVL